MFPKLFGLEKGYRVFLRAHVQIACNCRRKFFWFENPTLGVYWIYSLAPWVAALLVRPFRQAMCMEEQTVFHWTLWFYSFNFLCVQDTKCLSFSLAVLFFIFNLCVLGTNVFYSARKFYSLVFVHVCWKQNLFHFPKNCIICFLCVWDTKYASFSPNCNIFYSCVFFRNISLLNKKSAYFCLDCNLVYLQRGPVWLANFYQPWKYLYISFKLNSIEFLENPVSFGVTKCNGISVGRHLV